MGTLIVLIILVVLLAANIFLYFGYKKTKEEVIDYAEAGVITSETKNDRLQPAHNTLTFFDKIKAGGKNINRKDYKQVFVIGKCMEARNIYEGDILFVQMFKDEDKRSAIKKNDILLIYLNDENHKGYKIRIFDCVDERDTNRAKTFCYDETGKVRFSSQSHLFDDIVGIGKFNLKPTH